jgi:catechol 2,3-dioxygenase-like lactoylglutathione lyase family enzyme
MVRYLTLCCLVALVSVALPGPAAASDTSPLAEAAELPLVFRRTTLIVRDIDDALALYRDALGMEVIYDEEIARPHPFEEREQRLRLIFLKASHAHVGVIGLIDYEYGYPEHPVHEKPVAREGFTPGNAVLIFNTTELESRWPDIESAPGVEIISAPKVTQYPGYGGEGTIEVLVSKFYDADGYLIELNQILSH